MENSSKGLCYRLFKDNSEIESFLDNLTYKNRITYVNIDLVIDHGNRPCNICTDAKIGDEFHYIRQCKSLDNENNIYPGHYFSHRINTLKFGQLFQLNINQN
jgi:hypothetical protein